MSRAADGPGEPTVGRVLSSRRMCRDFLDEPLPAAVLDPVLDAALEKKIRDQIRRNTTPRHVPARIVQIADIPRTKSGKITELAVRDVVHGRAVRNKEALANPEALDLYRDLPQLAR